MLPDGTTENLSCNSQTKNCYRCSLLQFRRCVFFNVFRSAINTGLVNVVKSTINQPVNQSVVLVVAVGLVALFFF
jgi:hypothetical protein